MGHPTKVLGGGKGTQLGARMKTSLVIFSGGRAVRGGGRGGGGGWWGGVGKGEGGLSSFALLKALLLLGGGGGGSNVKDQCEGGKSFVTRDSAGRLLPTRKEGASL